MLKSSYVNLAHRLHILLSKNKKNLIEEDEVNPTAAKINSTKDPVCGMTVNPEKTDIVATVEGHTYPERVFNWSIER